MSTYIHALRIGLVGLSLLGTVTGGTRAAAQSVTPEETVRGLNVAPARTR